MVHLVINAVHSIGKIILIVLHLEESKLLKLRCIFRYRQLLRLLVWLVQPIIEVHEMHLLITHFLGRWFHLILKVGIGRCVPVFLDEDVPIFELVLILTMRMHFIECSSQVILLIFDQSVHLSARTFTIGHRYEV